MRDQTGLGATISLFEVQNCHVLQQDVHHTLKRFEITIPSFCVHSKKALSSYANLFIILELVN